MSVTDKTPQEIYYQKVINSGPQDDYERKLIKHEYHCYDWPLEWPCWVGGNKDFLTQGQPFDKLLELREATMLEM